LHRQPWLARLRHALRKDLLAVHYQPIVPLRPGRIGGVRPTHYEALIRLADDPGGRLSPPGEFLPAAERYGLICQLDRAVIAKTLALIARGDCGAQACIAVNLSALSITEPGMLAYIERQFAHHGVDPARLIVEVTETAAISDMRLARAFCAGVNRLGSAVALDDFGTGFGSFQYLRQLPFQYLKIDGEFIRGLAHSHEDRLLVQALVGLASSMGKRTIAEYAEAESAVALLREYGVDYAQGYAVGPPRCAREAFGAS
jgi:EAL domain-containing protein (putative c-di-GMP-specific phosphodiesterase class I)